MGFIPDIERIVSQVFRRNRQTLMFSATLPPEIRRLADQFLNNPISRCRYRRRPPPRRRSPRRLVRVTEGGQAPTRCASLIRSGGRQERADLLQPQARCRGGSQIASQPTASTPARCMATWRNRPAPRRWGEVQGRRTPADGVQRRRGARPRHQGFEPRVQFRRADPLPRIMSIASAAPAAPACRAGRSPWSRPMTTQNSWPRIEKLIGTNPFPKSLWMVSPPV